MRQSEKYLVSFLSTNFVTTEFGPSNPPPPGRTCLAIFFRGGGMNLEKRSGRDGPGGATKSGGGLLPAPRDGAEGEPGSGCWCGIGYKGGQLPNSQGNWGIKKWSMGQKM